MTTGKTSRDWLSLLIQLLGALAIPVAIAIGTAWFSYQQNQTSLQIANDQQLETTLQTYLNQMSDLVLHNGLTPDSAAVAKAQTITVLHRLDPSRKGIVLQFLHDIDVITVKHHHQIIDLSTINLDHIKIDLAILNNVDLSGASLKGAILERVNLSNADLGNTDLSGADLRNADLRGTNLSGANLTGTDLSEANLYHAKVTNGQLAKAKSLKGTIMPNGSKHP